MNTPNFGMYMFLKKIYLLIDKYQNDRTYVKHYIYIHIWMFFILIKLSQHLLFNLAQD